MQKPTVDDLVKKIHEAKGNMSQVARIYDRPRSTVQGWIADSVNATQALEDARETRVDTAETLVYKLAATEDSLQAAFYILNNDPLAKKRGWGPRQEITGADGKDIKPVVYIKENRPADD